MELPARLAIILGLFVAMTQIVVAVGDGDAEAMYDSFNKAFLIRSGSDVFYKQALDKQEPDGTWAGSLDILGAEDAYERTGDPEKKSLVNDLLTTWLKNTPPPWNWDGWNDDIGWFTLALIRGYQITGNTTFLNQAKYGFDYAFGRGWDTKYNDGGIWEENPEYADKEDPPRQPTKEALSNDSLGKVACMIYQSTHDENYLTKCRNIYDWVWNHLYNSGTGQINSGIDESGHVDTSATAYNQGTFLDFANLIYEITGEVAFYNDAKRAIDYARRTLTVNGIFSNAAGYLNTWADETARGVGHFVRDNRLWDTYHSWMVQNADAILQNQRTDLGITWNAWDQRTPADDTLQPNKFVGAMAWLQFTPAALPNEIGGIHVVTNQMTGMAIDSAGAYGNGNIVIQWGLNNSQNQRWLFTQNSDASWNIINLATWQSLDCPGGSDGENLTMVQWQPTRESNQRWWIDQQSDGTYKIWNKASGKVLDGISSTNNGATLVQQGWNGSPRQHWILK
ncbi:MAG: hypothetical protein LQ340_004861 [Diploschistes diacapsis]|nr:MAG: hypothetical protein LQ340_004861 [Diploschistes diacapsis]